MEMSPRGELTSDITHLRVLFLIDYRYPTTTSKCLKKAANVASPFFVARALFDADNLDSVRLLSTKLHQSRINTIILDFRSLISNRFEAWSVLMQSLRDLNYKTLLIAHVTKNDCRSGKYPENVSCILPETRSVKKLIHFFKLFRQKSVVVDFLLGKPSYFSLVDLPLPTEISPAPDAHDTNYQSSQFANTVNRHKIDLSLSHISGISMDDSNDDELPELQELSNISNGDEEKFPIDKNRRSDSGFDSNEN